MSNEVLASYLFQKRSKTYIGGLVDVIAMKNGDGIMASHKIRHLGLATTVMEFEGRRVASRTKSVVEVEGLGKLKVDRLSELQGGRVA